jgi:hypothetical protein
MNYYVLRVEKDYEATFHKLVSVTSDLVVIDHQVGHNKLWIKGLLHQIHLMSNGVGVLISPLPIRSLNNLLIG